MSKPSTIPRPTEAAALGRCQPKPLPALTALYRLLALAVRRHDRHGAALLRFRLVRVLASGEVGA